MADPIEHLRQVLKSTMRELIAREGGIQNINAHEIVSRLVEKFAPETQHYSHEGGHLCRELVETSVKSILAEERLRQHFKVQPDEEKQYKSFWNSLS